MDLTALVTDKPKMARFTEFDGPGGTGNIVPPVGKVAFESSDPTVATVDAATGQLAYFKAGSTVITGSDDGNALNASGTLTLTLTPVAVSAVLDFVDAPTTLSQSTAPGNVPVSSVHIGR